MSEADYAICLAFGRRVYDALRTEAISPFRSFMDRSCGRNIRAAMGLVHALLMGISRAQASEASVGVYHWITAVLNHLTLASLRTKRGAGRPNRSVIQNLFDVDVTGEQRGLLTVKTRILLALEDYLARGITVSINDLYWLLLPFGYSQRLIMSALNELLDPFHQLVRSDGFDSFTDQTWEKGMNTLVELTEIGEGYVARAALEGEPLIGALRYVGAAMLLARIPLKAGERIAVACLTDYLLLVSRFLREIARQDSSEVWHYVSECSGERYVGDWGPELLSVRIARPVLSAVIRICRSEIQEAQKAGDGARMIDRLKGLLSDYQDLWQDLGRRQYELFGEWPAETAVITQEFE